MTTGRKLVFGIGFGIPVLCCLGGILLVFVSSSSSKRNLERELALTRQAGIPTEISYLESFSNIPSTQNAAPIYAKAIGVLARSKSLQEAQRALQKSFAIDQTSEKSEMLADNLRQLQPLFSLLRSAVQRPRYSSQRNWQAGAAMTFPDLAQMRTFTKDLVSLAEFQSLDGRPQLALATLRDAFLLAAHVGQEPIVINELVRVACEAIAQAELDRLLARHNRDNRFLLEAKRLIDNLPDLPDLRLLMTSEFILMRQTIREAGSAANIERAFDSGNTRTSFGDRFWRLPGLKDAMEADLVHNFRVLISRLPKDARRWDQAEFSTRRLAAFLEANVSPVNLVSREVISVYPEVFAAIGRMQAKRRIALTAIAVYQLRNEAGRLPSALPNLGSGSIDPFTGRPLKYVLLPKGGFRLYSVGRDRTDDLGRKRNDAVGGNFDDVTDFK